MKRVGISTSNIRSGNFSLARLSGYNLDAVRKADGLPLMIGSAQDPSLAKEYISQIDALILTGGNDLAPFNYGEDPNTDEIYDFQRDAFELELFKEAMEANLPILCICRGLQLANVARGGKNIKDLKKSGYKEIIHAIDNVNWNEETDTYHQIDILKDSSLYKLIGKETIVINSIHHQAIRELGENMKTVAKARDGVIEAVEMTDYENFIGFQFHPERLQNIQGFRNVYSELIRRA